MSKEQVIQKLKSGAWFCIRECSLCDTGLHYFSEGDKLFFQSHCACVTYENIEQRDWSELDFYIEHSAVAINKFLSLEGT